MVAKETWEDIFYQISERGDIDTSKKSHLKSEIRV